MKSQPRKLQFYKCTQCRKDRQKCTPVDRDWPTQRCDRCNKFGYSCSESMTARGTLRRDPSISQGKQPVQPNDNGGTNNVSSAELLHDLNFPKLTSTIELEKMYASFFLGEAPIGSQSKPKCADLFGALNTAYWANRNALISPATNSESSSDRAFRLGEQLLLMAEVYTLYALLNHRELLVLANKMHEKEVAAHIGDGANRNEAVKLAIAKLIQRLPHDNEDKSATDFIVGVARTVREGDRWQRLIDAVGSREILLIGCEEDEDEDSDEEDSHDDLENVQALEKRFRKNHNSVNIGKIFKTGSDNVFAKMEELLLSPALQLKETCHRLSGLSHMINRFKDSSNHGELILTSSDKGHNVDSDLSSFLASEIHRRLKEVFGEAEPEKRTSSGSCEPGGTSDVVGSDEQWGFEEDFCINLSNSKAFESADWI